MEITYSKGIYTLTDGTKTYTYNINDGNLINAKTNNIVSKPPFKRADMEETLHQSLEEFYYNGCYSNMLEVLFDSLRHRNIYDTFGDNVQYLAKMSAWDKLLNVRPKGYALRSDCHGLTKLSNKQISKIAKKVQAYNNPDRKYIDLEDFINQLEIEELATTWGNLPIDFVSKYKLVLKTLYALGEGYRDVALYYFYNQKLYKFRVDETKCSYREDGHYCVMTYIKLCKTMNKTPIKTNNFMREYIETLNAYDLWCETDKQNRFSAIYNKYKENLLFEHGNYQVVLPQLTQDLITEGSEMHHCVGGYIDNVANGDTLIVFIRHKDTPNQCYITAQIRPHNGQLGQYYLSYDRRIEKEEDIEFKQKYQEWLFKKQW